MRKLAFVLIGVVVLAALAAGGYYVALFYVSGQLRTALDQSLTHVPAGWKASYKEANLTSLFPRTLVIRGLEMHHTLDTPVDGIFDEVTVVNPTTQVADSSFDGRLGDTMILKGLTVHADDGEVKIASIRIDAPHRYPASTAAPASAPDLPPELAQAIAELDRSGFISVTIDDVTTAGGGAIGGIKQITVGAFDRGALNGAIAFSGFSARGTGTDKSVVSLDRFEIVQPNFRIVSDWQKVAADPSKLTPDTILPIVKAVTLKGLSFVVNEPGVDGGPATDGKIRLDSAQLTDLRVYPAALLKNGGLGAFEQAMSHPPEDFDIDSLLPMLRAEAAGVLSVGYGSAIDGIDANITVPEGDTIEHVTYKLKHADTVNYDRGRLDRSEMDGFSLVVDPEADISIDKVELTGLDVREACRRLAAGGAVEPSLLDGISLARYAYSGISMRGPELKQPITLGSIALSNIGFSHGMPASIEFALNGLKVSKAQMNEADAIDAFTKMGLDTLTTSFSAAYKWDAGTQIASLHDVNLKVDELGAASLQVDFIGIGQPEQLEQTARLRGATLHYKDASLVGRALKVAAQESGADPAAFRTQLATMIQAQSKAVLGPSPAATAATSAVLAFLADPRELTVQVTPPQPIGSELADQLDHETPPKIFQALGVKVTANQAAR